MRKVIIGLVVVLVILVVAAVVFGEKLPPGIHNGDVIRCAVTGKIFKVEGGKKRYYSWNAYVKDLKPTFTNVSCEYVSAIPDGADMPE